MPSDTMIRALLVLLVSFAAAFVVTARSEINTPGQSSAASEAALTRNFYFIFDGSGSMSDSLTRQCRGDKRVGSRIEGAKWAIEQFLPLVPSDVNLGLWVFDAHGNSERVPLSPDARASFLVAVKKVRAGGRTPLTE